MEERELDKSLSPRLIRDRNVDHQKNVILDKLRDEGAGGDFYI